jgi:hypothetical protein
MKQALYAHMNNKRKMKKKKNVEEVAEDEEAEPGIFHQTWSK